MIEPPDLDEAKLHRSRLTRLRATMAEHGIDLCLLTNPVSIRYATGYRAYATFQSRIPSQYCLVPVEGPIAMHGAYVDDLELIDWCHVSHAVTAFDAGLDPKPAAEAMAADVADFAAAADLPADLVLGVERATPTGLAALRHAGFVVVDAEATIELARSRKDPLELDALRYAIAVAEHGIAQMAAALTPGITENQLFAELHRTNIAHDGDWIDGRMLCSGPRTNPWYQEASSRAIRAGDMVAFDTDMIGPFGYCADISRTWVCDSTPTDEQRDLHGRAVEEIDHNTSLLSVGASFAELSQKSFRQPERFVANRYACLFHGVGMSDEYPKIAYPQDWHWTGYDGEIEDGLVLSVESYVGASGGSQGIKLEQMVRVTREGVVPLSTYPIGLTA